MTILISRGRETDTKASEDKDRGGEMQPRTWDYQPSATLFQVSCLQQINSWGFVAPSLWRSPRERVQILTDWWNCTSLFCGISVCHL
jgi:hypothetical protein